MNDKNNAVKKLQSAAKTIKYAKLDISEVKIGSPKEYLKLYHYLFVDYSPLLAAEILSKHQMELSMKNDKSFMDSVYKLTRDMFEYVPKLSRDQFFTTNYAQVKALMAVDIIQLIHQKAKALQPASSLSTAATAAAVVSSFNHIQSQPSSSIAQQLPTVMPSVSHSVAVIKAGRAVHGAEETASKLATQAPKSTTTHSYVQLHGQARSGSSLARSASVNLGTNRGFAPREHRESRHMSRNQAEGVDGDRDSESPRHGDLANSLLATHVSEISSNLNLLLARMERFENFVQAQQQQQQQQSDEADMKNSTVVHRDIPEAVDELRGMVMATRKDQESINKRVTLLENENLVLKHQNKLLNAQLGQQQAFIQQLLHLQTTPSSQGIRSSANRAANNGPLLNQDYSDDDNRGDETAFETPFHSFMVSNEDDEAVSSSSRRSNSRKISSTSTTSSQSAAADYVQIPTIGSTTTPPAHRALFAQGELHDHDAAAENLSDLSLSSNQITDPNDLTPTMDVTSYKTTTTTTTTNAVINRHHHDAMSMGSPLSNDVIIRAKQLVDRASQLNEQIQAKK